MEELAGGPMTPSLGKMQQRILTLTGLSLTLPYIHLRF